MRFLEHAARVTVAAAALFAAVGSAIPNNSQIANGKSTTMDVDGGQFAYYAGPTDWYAPGKCIQWARSETVDSWVSPPSHCH